ncbi:proteolipid protein DM beta-like [Oppia nitens]|uniref:proteolipid protein DM beta-like n=1 Tax=Oppia nitens TaxID=1686743 RepID=UPI0023DB50C8|nr:proteolipid protein DM beta-like [Oppia nitens]
MLRNADVSYSSIAPTRGSDNSQCLCCFCTWHCSHCKSCCRSCFLRLPYGTITSTILGAFGLIMAIISILHSTTIADRLTHDLIRRKYYWLSDLKVWYVVLAIFLSVIIVINLFIGFATTGKTGAKNGKSCRTCGCNRSSTTTCLIKTIFVVNYILFYLLLVLTIVVLLTLFICYMLSNLCNEGAHMIIDPQNANWPYPTDTRAGQSAQYIDLRQFSPLLSLRSNETQYMYFKDDRLKKLCGDYVSALSFYIVLCAIGMVALCSAFLNFLINLSVNWVRIGTKQKYAELMYLNGAEMTAFNDGAADHNSRY